MGNPVTNQDAQDDAVEAFTEAAGDLITSVKWVEGNCCACGEHTRMKAGLLTDQDDIPIICDDCDTNGQAAVMETMRAEHGQAYLETSGAPEEMPAVPMHPRLERFLVDDRPGMWLCGSTGSYKTSMAAQFIKAWCTKIVRPALYITEHQLAESLKDWDNRAKNLSRFGHAPLLVLDDLGKSHQKEFGAADIFEIIDRRYSSRRTAGGLKKTLLISEHSVDTLVNNVERFDDAALKRRFDDLCGDPQRLSRPKDNGRQS